MRKKNNTWTVASPEETIALGQKLAEELAPGDIVCFEGTLGAGKTTLIKGIIRGLSQVNENEVLSPTFTYMNLYDGTPSVCHFDLYRLSEPEQFITMGFIEYFDQDHISLIEWPDRILPYLPKDAYFIDIQYEGEQTRGISIR